MPQELSTPPKIHAVVFTEGSWCVAQCLEYDIATQARSMSDLYAEIKRIIGVHFLIAQKEGRVPFANIPKAPQRFWTMYETAYLSLKPVRHLRLVSPPAVEIELRAA